MNNLILSSWNVRGLNNLITIKNIKKLIRDSKTNILFLQETKCYDWSNSLIDRIWDSINHDWIAVDSIGAAGGLLISWDKQILTLSKVDNTQHWLWCKGSTSLGESFNLVNIYGPHDLTEKQVFWNDLRNIHQQVDKEPLCLMGDFNSVTSKEDRANCVQNNRDMTSFNVFIDETGLIELQGANFLFTWFGPKDKKSRLDRVLVNDKWILTHQWKVSAGHRRSSDHLPLTLASDSTNWGPKPFRAFDDWMQLEEIQSLLVSTVQNNTSKSWFGIIKEIKLGLKQWSKGRSKMQASEVESLERELQNLDGMNGNYQKKAEIFQKLQQAYQSEIIQLNQKARLKWDIEGDNNTRFFHKTVQQRKRRNYISKLWWNNTMLTNPSEIKNGLFQDFSNFFDNNGGSTPFSLRYLEWSILPNEDVITMTRKFTKEEIWVALQECDSKKAPGPDGLNSGWLKKVWPSIADKILMFFEEFHEKATIPLGVNSSFLVLIPKKIDPICTLDFRPISLINSSLKLLLKVLANRIKQVLNFLISEEQTAFVKGRNINESILLVNEVIHAMKIQKSDGLIFKIDFSKAYNSVDWSCLLHVMECMNFDQKWITWIRALLESTKMSILINGSPTEEFRPRRGLRQGDPIAPYLYLLIGEVLCKLINRAVERGKYKGVKFDFHQKPVTHFQYADDTVLFVKNDENVISEVKKLLLLFQAITGLAVNFKKSLVYHASNDTSKLASATQILGCQAGEVPFKYLGDWVGLEKRSALKWKSLTDQVQSKLQTWKCNSLNMAGRMVLIKSSLDSIPNYWFSLHKIPNTITKRLDKIRRSFFWGDIKNGEESGRKMHTVNWNLICSSKDKGGLSLSRIELKNQVLLSKWWWKFHSNKDK